MEDVFGSARGSRAMVGMVLTFLVFFTPLSCLSGSSPAAEGVRAAEEIMAGDFSGPSNGEQSLPAGWKPLFFPHIRKHTVYSIESKDGDSYLRGISNASASALYRAIDIKAADYPVLSWRWKIDKVLKKGDARTKAGDDYAARIYVTFAYEPSRASLMEAARHEIGERLFGESPPGSALNYIWGNRLQEGAFIINPYSVSDVMIAVESGNKEAGLWKKEERNVYEDYIKAFGHKPPQITGIAVMTDSDNTGGHARGYYDDIIFRKKPSLKE